MFEVFSSVLFHLSTFVLTFYGLCILCDEHLVPAVEVFIKQFQVPEEVAAVTLVAFGSAAPELFLNTVSAFTHTSDLSLSAILGSGMIAFGFIPPLCLLFTHHTEMAIRVYPLIRECGFYLIGLLFFVIALHDGKIETNEALILLLVYLCYVTMVLVIYWQEKQQREIKKILHEFPEIKQMLNSATPTAQRTKNPNNESNLISDVEDLSLSSPHPSSLKLEELQSLLQHHTPMKDNTQITISPVVNSSLRSMSSSPPTPPPPPPSQTLTISKKYSEDVDDARSTENLRYNHYYERLIHQINHVISTPIREIMKFIVPTLLTPEDTPDSPYNLFNMIHSQIPHLISCLSSLIVIILATPPQRRGRGGAGNAPTIPIHLVEGESRINRGGDDDEEFQTLLPTVSSSSRLHKSASISPAASAADGEGAGSGEDDHHLKVPLWRVFLVVGVCIVFISGFASLIVFASESLIRSLGLDISTMGVTLVAFGSEIPDTISAIALARSGYHDGALAGAIGSQVINISIGVGIPSLFICLTGRGYLKLAAHEADNLWFLSCLLFVVIGSLLVLTVPFDRIMNLPIYSSLTKTSAMIQISVCIIIYLIFLSFN